MVSLGCEEYRDLRLQYEVAKRRLWRYTHPSSDPVLGAAGVTPNHQRVLLARADEGRLARSLHEHAETCTSCRVTVEMPGPRSRSMAS